MSRPRVLYAPSESHTQQVFTPATWEALTKEFDVTAPRGEKAMTVGEMESQIGGHDALMTGWGVPDLTEKLFVNGTRLKMIAHTAGTVKKLINAQLFEKHVHARGIIVFSAHKAIAFNVAETTVGLLLMASHRWVDHVTHYWETGQRRKDIPRNGQYLMGGTIGIISASAVGRWVIRLLQAFPGCRVLLYDPYVSDAQAREMNVEKVSLNDLFRRADHVTIHAPTTPETEKMIGAEQLKLLRDDAALINTARGWVLDHDALLAECRKGRFQVVLDVTTPEPLPPDSPFRALRNVMILPHIAGQGFYGYHKIGESSLQALRDGFAGRPVDGRVTLERLALMA